MIKSFPLAINRKRLCSIHISSSVKNGPPILKNCIAEIFHHVFHNFAIDTTGAFVGANVDVVVVQVGVRNRHFEVVRAKRNCFA